MRTIYIAITCTLTLAALALIAHAHSGDTDPAGCHTCWTNCSSQSLAYGEYHCH